MTSAQIRHVWKLYQKKLEGLLKLDYWKGLSKEYEDLKYLAGMVPRFPDFVEEKEKAMRWLCFMQGVFWTLRIYTVDELREHNASKPNKFDVQALYNGHSLGQHYACSVCGDLDGCHKWREYAEAAD